MLKIKEAQKLGEYKETLIDENKKTSDFRILQMSPVYIRWNDGKGEIVSKTKLKSLQKTNTWATDF